MIDCNQPIDHSLATFLLLFCVIDRLIATYHGFATLFLFLCDQLIEQSIDCNQPINCGLATFLLLFLCNWKIDCLIDRLQLADRPWPHHLPAPFCVRPIDWTINWLQPANWLRPHHLPAPIFVWLINQTNDQLQPANWLRPRHHPASFLCDQSIKQSINCTWPMDCGLATFLLLFCVINWSIKRLIATGQLTMASPPSCSFFVWSIDRTIDQLHPANQPWPCHLPAPFFVQLIDWSNNQSQLANPLQPCHLPAPFLCDQLIKQLINRTQPIDHSLATFLLFFVWSIDQSIKWLIATSQSTTALPPSCSFFCAINRLIAPGQLTAALPPSCCFFAIDWSIKWSITTGQSTVALPPSCSFFCAIDWSIATYCSLAIFVLFFVWPIDQTINQSQWADWLHSCHLPAPFLCDQSIDQTINCSWPIDRGLATFLLLFCEIVLLIATYHGFATLFVFLRLIDWLIDQSQPANWPRPCHFPALFVCDQSINNRLIERTINQSKGQSIASGHPCLLLLFWQLAVLDSCLLPFFDQSIEGMIDLKQLSLPVASFFVTSCPFPWPLAICFCDGLIDRTIDHEWPSLPFLWFDFGINWSMGWLISSGHPCLMFFWQLAILASCLWLLFCNRLIDWSQVAILACWPVKLVFWKATSWSQVTVLVGCLSTHLFCQEKIDLKWTMRWVKMTNNVFQLLVLNVVWMLFSTVTARVFKNHRNLDCSMMQVTSFGKSYIRTTIQERYPCSKIAWRHACQSNPVLNQF